MSEPVPTPPPGFPVPAGDAGPVPTRRVCGLASRHGELLAAQGPTAGSGPGAPGSSSVRGVPAPDGPPPPPRPGLAERQAALVAALVAGAEPPEGFDPALLAATAAGLLAKRAGDVARAWPELARSLGSDWRPWFAGWAAGRPPGGSHADGLAAARDRAAAGELVGAAAVELAVREVARLPWWAVRWDRATRVLRVAGRTFVPGR